MKSILLFIAISFFSLGLYAQQFTISDAESKVAFAIKNIGLNVAGSLKGLKGMIQFNPKNLNASMFDVTVDINTINTSNNKRDAHLKKEDFFDAATYPAIRIATTQMVAKGGNNYRAIANLTIKNIIKKITFDFIATPTPTGYKFMSSFIINRLDFKVGGTSMLMDDIVMVQLSVISTR